MEIKQLESKVLGSNTYILKNEHNSIIIDAGAELETVLEETNGTTVRAIFLTHLHFDHCYNLLSMVNKFNCKVYLFNSELVNNPNYTLSQMVGGLNLPTNCYVSIGDNKQVELEGFKVKCYHTAGHSADCMCYQINDCLFSGDTLFYGSIGRTDLLASNKLDMLNSLEMLKGLTFTTCYSGHGQSSTYAEQQENINYFLLEL